MNRFILSALCLSLAGCYSNPRVEIDAGLLQPCPAIPDTPDTVDMGELLLMDIELAGMYRECAASKAGLIKAVTP